MFNNSAKTPQSTSYPAPFNMQDECPICCENATAGNIVLPCSVCNVVLHRKCLTRYNQNTCPCCRGAIKPAFQVDSPSANPSADLPIWERSDYSSGSYYSRDSAYSYSDDEDNDNEKKTP